eukprot:gnl/TRDRNA2_/TRDRNA2_36762_c0_seq1.p1 gnl/TRDRNA2_/TRDRNA2_36762_c0~~gnl/TRDRNA2_/TRDRNA2_36762_c0_seq1.p1  ORF type:complete len:383 (-),score=49.99 gnl/TRDRNA2_/TRDRNA2_36762_c0_seq1:70-1218(-)
MQEDAPLKPADGTAKDYGTSGVPSETPTTGPDLETGKGDHRSTFRKHQSLAETVQAHPPVVRVEDMPEEHRRKYAEVSEVGIAMKIVSISNVDMAQDSFDACFNIIVAWKGEKEDGPELHIYNAQLGIEMEKQDIKSGSKGWDWFYRVRVQGTFRQEYVLNMFPFDHQHLNITVRFNSKCKLVHVPWSPSGEACTCDPRCLMDDYILTDFKVLHRYFPHYQFTELAGYDPEASLILTIGRKSFYWVVNYGGTSTLTASLMATAYSIPVENVGERLGVATTLVLTMLATKFLMMEKLPSVAYFTILDKHMNVSLFFLCFLTGQMGLTGVFGVPLTRRIEHAFLPTVGIVWLVYHVIAITLVLWWSRMFKYSRMGNAMHDFLLF